MQAKLEIHFLSDWHISSGLGDGHWADSLLVRDSDGLPYIPGRALKGALREGARRLGLCREDLRIAENLFWGTRQDAVESNVAGYLRVSAALLPSQVKQALAYVEDKEAFVRDMTLIRKHTALEDGKVVEHSLRSIECGMAGLCFEATIECVLPPDMDEIWVRDYLVAVCAAVKSVGAHRSRGLGRCHLVFDSEAKKIALPLVAPNMVRLQGASS